MTRPTVSESRFQFRTYFQMDQLPDGDLFQFGPAAVGEELNGLAVAVGEDLVGDRTWPLSAKTSTEDRSTSIRSVTLPFLTLEVRIPRWGRWG